MIASRSPVFRQSIPRLCFSIRLTVALTADDLEQRKDAEQHKGAEQSGRQNAGQRIEARQLGAALT